MLLLFVSWRKWIITVTVSAGNFAVPIVDQQFSTGVLRYASGEIHRILFEIKMTTGSVGMGLFDVPTTIRIWNNVSIIFATHFVHSYL
jgi:hypothetical protein